MEIVSWGWLLPSKKFHHKEFVLNPSQYVKKGSDADLGGSGSEKGNILLTLFKHGEDWMGKLVPSFEMSVQVSKG